jgi:hypothetical protein
MSRFASLFVIVEIAVGQGDQTSNVLRHVVFINTPQPRLLSSRGMGM